MKRKSLHKFVLEEWRGLPEKRQERPLIAISEAIQQLVAKLGLRERINESDIQGAWREIVGDFLAQHSQPSRLVNGLLHIQVMQSSVRYELDRTWRMEILNRLQARFGKNVIKDIKL